MLSMQALPGKTKKPETNPARFSVFYKMSFISSYRQANRTYQPFALPFPLFLAQWDH